LGKIFIYREGDIFPTLIISGTRKKSNDLHLKTEHRWSKGKVVCLPCPLEVARLNPSGLRILFFWQHLLSVRRLHGAAELPAKECLINIYLRRVSGLLHPFRVKLKARTEVRGGREEPCGHGLSRKDKKPKNKIQTLMHSTMLARGYWLVASDNGGNRIVFRYRNSKFCLSRQA